MAADEGEIEGTANEQGDGTYTAAYTSTDTVGEAEITAVTGNGVVGTIKLKLIETVVSAKKSKVTVSAAPKTGETVTVEAVLLSEEDLALSGKEVSQIVVFLANSSCRSSPAAAADSAAGSP